MNEFVDVALEGGPASIPTTLRVEGSRMRTRIAE